MKFITRCIVEDGSNQRRGRCGKAADHASASDDRRWTVPVSTSFALSTGRRCEVGSVTIWWVDGEGVRRVAEE